jgi:hypothetical protein
MTPFGEATYTELVRTITSRSTKKNKIGHAMSGE